MRGLVGKYLDHYQIVAEVGQGGMAVVYRALDTHSDQEVALKVMSPTIAGDRRFIRRFRREGGLLARMNHPGIVPVLDYGESDGYVYLAMQFIQGRTLASVLKAGGLKLAQVRRWIRQVSEALEYAHSQGVIHRDVKPSNIIITDAGDAMLTDFGLAREVEGSNTLTGSMLLGTPAYMSPEQAQGKSVEEASDQYSLGVILYQIFTGRLPFEEESPMATLMMHVREPVPRPRRFNAAIPEPVERVILKSLAKKPAFRYPSVTALLDALQAALSGESMPQETQVMLPEKPVLRTRERQDPPEHAQEGTGRDDGRGSRKPFPILVLAVVVLAVVMGGVWLVQRLSLAESSPDILPVYDAQTGLTETEPAVMPEPTMLPTAVKNAACPGLSMFNFQHDGAVVSWSLDNSLDHPVQLVNAAFLVPQDNWIVSLILAREALLNLDPFSPPDSAAELEIPADERTVIPAGSTVNLELRYAVSDLQPGYGVEFHFDEGCVLQTGW